ncbi:hypothetical protein [Nonomuraea typhae]|uniref:Twin-arginine translocation signal domain-containing protein n=1 Tax=Nonomuraea typhae TaxID=2603600 RepID=A0ABW7Z1S8_9ACTN|nr:hypothetical protein [Nonomuraea typhae]
MSESVSRRKVLAGIIAGGLGAAALTTLSSEAAAAPSGGAVESWLLTTAKF